MRKPLLMMRGKSLLGPLFGRFKGARAGHPLAHSAGNFISIGGSAPQSAFITGTVTTDTAGGRLYALVDTSALDPAAAAVKSGAQHSQAVSSVGVQTVKINADAFGAGTYYIHYVQETTGFSNVITSPSFVIP